MARKVMMTIKNKDGSVKSRKVITVVGGRKQKTRLSSGMRKAVQKIVKGQIETKYLAEDIVPTSEAGLAARELWGDTVPAGGPAQVFPVMPEVPESTTTANEYTREGVKINPTRLEVDVELFFNNLRRELSNAAALDTVSWDINVHMWYGYVRKYKNNADIVANNVLIAENLLEGGDGSTYRFQGGPLDHFKKLNSEYVQGMKHKVIRMSRPLGEQNLATAAGGLTTYFPQKINKTVRLRFKTPKTLRFNEQNVYPENYAPILIIGYQHNDNSQAANTWIANGVLPTDVLRAPALCCAIRSHLWFKDA